MNSPVPEIASRPAPRRGLESALCVATLALIVAGCSTWRAPADISDTGLRERAVTAARENVRLSATVLSAQDSRRLFGADINQSTVQTVWVEVQNQTPEPLWLLRPGTDPDYFSPLEVAWSLHKPLARETNARIDDHFDRLGFKNPVAPGETRAGMLFTKPEHITKLLNVDLFQRKTLIPFTLFLRVPDDVPDLRPVQELFRYADAEITNYQDPGALRAALARLPCCANDARGDPFNAVFIGELPDIAAALVRRSYRRDERGEDKPQQAFGRGPDAVLRKQAQAGAPTTWIRAWLAPIRFQGRAVYLAQVGRPVGGRFTSSDTKGIALQEDVDEARNLFVQDMMYSGGLEKLGFVSGAGAKPPPPPRTTTGGAPYHTDGLRAVLFLATRPISLSDVKLLDWEPAPDAGDENGNARP